jgi:dihydropyrimidinase
MNVDYSAYEGRRVTGQVESVLSRGELVIDGRKHVGRAGHGTFVPRSTCQYLG